MVNIVNNTKLTKQQFHEGILLHVRYKQKHYSY